MNRALFATALFMFVWPTVTIISLALSPLQLPLGIQTFATCTVLVPTMVYAVVPALSRVLPPQS